MEYIYIGKLVNTHGIKGEVRIKSDFEKKDLVFQKDFKLFIGKKKDLFIINSYRVHKDYDMVTFNGINNINEIEKYKGEKVFINKKDLLLKKDEYLYQDLIGLEVYEDAKLVGKVSNYLYNKAYLLLEVIGDNKFYIPLIDEYVIKVDINNNKVYVKNVSGLIV